MNPAGTALGPRLEAVVRAAGPDCGRLADIGTDHALAAARLLLSGSASSAVLSDLRRGPLERAAETVRKYGLGGRAQLRLSDGFENIGADEFDTALICGVGGLCIIGILSRAPWLGGSGKRLILQPQTDAEALRAFLYDSRWETESETAVQEGRHCYCVMRVVCSGRGAAAEAGAYAAPDPARGLSEYVWRGGLDPRRPDDRLYLERSLRETEKRACGALAGGDAGTNRLLSEKAALMRRALGEET